MEYFSLLSTNAMSEESDASYHDSEYMLFINIRGILKVSIIIIITMD